MASQGGGSYRIILIKRKKPLKYQRALTASLSLITGILLFTTTIAFIGISPLITLRTIASTFFSFSIIKDVIMLSLLGYALLIAFRGSLWNIGAEGQLHIAYLAVCYVTLILFFTGERVPLYQSLFVIALSLIVAVIAGALWGALAGLIKAYTGVDEVPVTLILNYIAYFIGNILVMGPMRGKEVYGYARTDQVPEAYRINFNIILPATANPILLYIRELIIYSVWLLFLVIIAIATWWLFNHTTLGLRVKILGSNPDYLIAAGIDIKKLTVKAFALSGGVVGLAAALYILGYLTRLEYPLEAQTYGYGYLAILVTWLSALDIALVPLSAYIVASLINAGQTLESLPEVKAVLESAGLTGVTISFRLLMFGSVLITYSILRFISEYELKVVRR